jgi:hypothetical protein
MIRNHSEASERNTLMIACQERGGGQGAGTTRKPRTSGAGGSNREAWANAKGGANILSGILFKVLRVIKGMFLKCSMY